VRGHYRLQALERVAHGLFQPKLDDEEPRAALRRRLEAWLLVLPEGACFTHLTAAGLLGWWLPKMSEHVPVFAAVTGDAPRPRRPGLIVSRLRRTEPGLGPLWVGALPVDHAEEILLRCARDLGVLDMTPLVDSARRLGHVDDKRMAAVLDSGRPGVAVLREAWLLSDARAESAMETLLRLFHHVSGVPVTPQVPLHDEAGRVVARADLGVDGTSHIHEYDGPDHRTREGQAAALRRERLLAGRYTRRAWTLHELLNQPMTVLHEIDRALGRQHRPERVQRWRTIVGNSMWDETSRERLLNRWRRRAGLNDWRGCA
jgi:hypothetical protein